MQISKRLRLGCLVAAALAAAVFVSGPDDADARPQYLKAFAVKYKNLTSQAKKQKCNVCHYGKKKKNRNDYGEALMKHVGKKNQKDPKKIDEALEKAAKEKKSKDKTFGDLIKAGKLPGTAPEDAE